MNVYEITPAGLQDGCSIHDGKLLLGQAGRGRKQVAITVPANGSIVKNRVLDIASPSSVVWVIIRDHSGFRGSWELLGAPNGADWEARVAIQRTHRPPDGDGAISEGHTDWLIPASQCPACKPAWASIPPRPAIPADWIRGEGRCAQGGAGRMGGGPEYLLALPLGASVEILRYGRLYGKAPWIRITASNEGSITLSNPKADALSRLLAASAWQ